MILFLGVDNILELLKGFEKHFNHIYQVYVILILRVREKNEKHVDKKLNFFLRTSKILFL